VLGRSLFAVAVAICGTAFLHASSLICTQATGTSNVFTNQSCSPLFSASASLNWGTPVDGSITGPMGSNMGGLGPASLSGIDGNWPAPAGTTLNAAINGNAFQITSNDQLTRADNTEWVWSGAQWIPSSFANADNEYFAGHFGAPTTPFDSPYGDNLLGALAPDGSNNGVPAINLTFSQGLQYIAFQVSSAVNSNFTAELIAFDSMGQKLGTYRISSTGGGGFCAGLTSVAPQPCDDAPLIQFFDPTTPIRSVELLMLTDSSGLFIDQLDVSPAPEPFTFLYVASSLLILWAARKRLIRVAVSNREKVRKSV
jgi:hypothetical protein